MFEGGPCVGRGALVFEGDPCVGRGTLCLKGGPYEELKTCTNSHFIRILYWKGAP